MENLSGEIIEPYFDEYTYVYKFGCKPGLTLFWIRGYLTTFQKQRSVLISSHQININEILRIGVVISDDHEQGAFIFPIISFFVINDGRTHVRNRNDAYI